MCSFVQILLPCEDNTLRRITQERPSYRVARYETLPLDIERSITAIIEREVEFIRQLDHLKCDLETRHDFTPFSAFRAIDIYNDGAINIRNLTHFLSSKGYFPTEREALNIIRRMDTSCAAAVSYNDFAEFLRGQSCVELPHFPVARPVSCERNSPRRAASPLRSSSPAKTSSCKKRSASVCKPIYVKKRICCDVCVDKYQPADSKEACCKDCEKKSDKAASPKTSPVASPKICCDCPCRYTYCRPDICLCRCKLYPCAIPACPCICRPFERYPRFAPYPVRCVSPVRHLSPTRGISPVKRTGLALCTAKEIELIQALRDILREEKDLEAAKITMARHSDFNFYDAFKVFDPLSKGYINHADLRDGLAAIGVFPSTTDIDLFFKRYERLGRNLGFAEFCEAFTPKTDSYLASDLGRRRSNFPTPSRYYARGDFLNASTVAQFRSLWHTHFKVEEMCESIRQRLRAIPHFDLYSAFLTCDLYDDGVISREELRRFIDGRAFYVSDSDAKQLVDKLDHNRDGVVSYGEVTLSLIIIVFSSETNFPLRATNATECSVIVWHELGAHVCLALELSQTHTLILNALNLYHINFYNKLISLQECNLFQFGIQRLLLL